MSFGSNSGTSDEHRFSRVGFRSSLSEIERWLDNQLTISTTHLISFLSSPEGLDILRQIADNRSLSSQIVIKLAKLVTQDGIRCSVERFETNKIYGAFLGSPFLTQIQSHVGAMMEPKPKDLWPFLHLFEEMQNRTADGWRFLPAEAFREAIDEIPEGAEKIEVYQQFCKLIEYRNKMKRLQQLSKSEEQYQGSTDVGSLPILPTEDEISSQSPEPLPINKVCQTYNSVDEYLSTHFRLVREDCFASLRGAIQGFRKNIVPDNIPRYKNVKFIGIQCGDRGLEHCILLKTTKEEAANSSSSKQMMSGSLLCISCDGFRNYVWGIVKDADSTSFQKGSIALKLIPSNEGKLASLVKNRAYEMIQSTAYYEAYVHVLECLQRPEMKELPFWEHFLSLEAQPTEPDYLKKRQFKDLYNLECAFPRIRNYLGRSAIHILQNWPQWNSTLDESQMEAVKLCLTKRLAIIQGPPGTGKTYVGLTIARILLSNVQCGPILVICYTNHALDQFLESIYSVENNIVRIGGGSKNEIMLKRSLNVLKRGPSTFGELRVRHGELMRAKRNVEEQIRRCTACVRATQISRGMLSGIASEQHIESLYSKDSANGQTIEDLWLKERVWNEYSSADTPLDYILSSQDLWLLPQKSRIKLHNHWLQKAKEKAEEELHRLSERYREVCGGLLEHDHKTSLKILREAKVVGMTTTGAAKNYDILQALRAEIVVIEEAAEVLEAHVLPCISSSTQHLILLGDHLQLRPSVAEYELATKYKLDVSLFERLISGGIEHVTLRCQRRMKPAISRLITDIYPTLRDHSSVINYESIKGIRNDVFFLDHQAMESEISNTNGKINISEARLAVELCVYLLRQGYKNSDITVLTMYKGQVSEIQRDLNDRLCPRNSQNEEIDDVTSPTPRVCSVDNYQGEEANIIILSLVRSNKIPGIGGSRGNIGFLKVVNRVCVALSRAKSGLYIFGNAELLASKSTLWESIIQKLENSNSIGPALTLTCQRHPQTEIKVSVAEDFRQMEDGGCRRPCEYQLKCGHACSRQCHPSDHDSIVCPKPCPKKFETCGHQCPKICHFPTYCPPCQIPVSKSLQPRCCHRITLPCSTPLRGIICNELCSIRLHCGHPCKQKCGRPCGPCKVNVIKALPCGHRAELLCYEDPCKFICDQPCGKVLRPGCEHICRGTCKSCKKGTSHIPCMERCFRSLPCGHRNRITLPCSTPLRGIICNELCSIRLHCGHPCNQKCGRPCGPCKVNVIKALPCGHQAELLCYEDPCKFICDQPCGKVLRPGCEHICRGTCKSCKQGTSHIPCMERCFRSLPCGHRCMADCSEICPPCKNICQKSCLHSNCGLICGSLCTPCMAKCEWQCEHHTCDLPCHETCTRPRCNQPCPKTLKCGHPCLGLCGEPCPRFCRVCAHKSSHHSTLVALDKCDPSARFVELVECGHIFEVGVLDTHMDMDNAGATAVKLKQCPECSSPIRRTLRYSNIVKTKLQQIEEVKKRVIGFQKVKRGNDMLKVKKYLAARQEFMEGLSSNPGLLEAHLGQACALCGLRGDTEAIPHLRFIIEQSTYKKIMMAKLPKLGLKSDSNNKNLDSKIADNELAIDALLQWVLVCSVQNDLATGLAICDLIQRRNPGHEKTAEIKGDLIFVYHAKRHVIDVKGKEMGERGHWYKCQNDHFYVVGECRGAMQTSECPDCKAILERMSHSSENSDADATGNRSCSVM